jgi:hypothetical protein
MFDTSTEAVPYEIGITSAQRYSIAFPNQTTKSYSGGCHRTALDCLVMERGSRPRAKANLEVPNAPVVGVASLPIYPLTITLAGCGRRGFADGHMLKEAYLDSPLDLCPLPDGTVLMTDGKNNCLRRLDIGAQQIITLSTSAFLGPRCPTIIDNGAAIVVCDSGHHKIRMLQFTDEAGNASLDVTSRGSSVMDCTIAGTGRQGFIDGSADAAAFNRPLGLCVIQDGSLLVADTGNNCIRRIAARAGKPGLCVSTIIGTAVAGFEDGVLDSARLKHPTTIVLDRYGTILISDTGNHAIRALHPPPNGDFSSKAWVLTTLAGCGEPGFADGNLLSSMFREPARLVVGSTGELVIADTGNHSIRAIVPGGVVSGHACLFQVYASGEIGVSKAVDEMSVSKQVEATLSGSKLLLALKVTAASNPTFEDDTSILSRVRQTKVVVLVPPSVFVAYGGKIKNDIVNFFESACASRLQGNAFIEGLQDCASPVIEVHQCEDVERVLAAHTRYNRVSSLAGPTPATVAAMLSQAPLVEGETASSASANALMTAAGLNSMLKRSRAAGRAAQEQQIISSLATYCDGESLTQARFRRPFGLCVLPSAANSILVADSGNHYARMLLANGAVEVQPMVLKPFLSNTLVQRGREAAVAARASFSSELGRGVAKEHSLSRDASPTLYRRPVSKAQSPIRSPTLAGSTGMYLNPQSPSHASDRAATRVLGSPSSTFGIAFGFTVAEQRVAPPKSTVSMTISTRKGPDITPAPLARQPSISTSTRKATKREALPEERAEASTRGRSARAMAATYSRPSTAFIGEASSFSAADLLPPDSLHGTRPATATPQASYPPPHQRPHSASSRRQRDSSVSRKRFQAFTDSATVCGVTSQHRPPHSFDDLGTLVQGVPPVARFSEELACNRHRAAYEQVGSRTALAAEDATSQGEIVRALLLSDVLPEHEFPGASKVTTADVRTLTSRYTQHTASSAAAVRAAGRPAIRNAPAFVNVANVVSYKLEDLRQKAAQGALREADEMALYGSPSGSSTPSKSTSTPSSRHAGSSHGLPRSSMKALPAPSSMARFDDNVNDLVLLFHPAFSAAR